MTNHQECRRRFKFEASLNGTHWFAIPRRTAIRVCMDFEHTVDILWSMTVNGQTFRLARGSIRCSNPLLKGFAPHATSQPDRN